jgi:ribosomal protein L11 methyltransferase
MSGPSKTWYAVVITLDAEAREAVEYALMEAGALGTETIDDTPGDSTATGYFAEMPERERIRDEMFDALRLYGLETAAVREMNLREVADRDWLGEWKKNWQPVTVGNRFVIAPPWSEVGESPGRIVIRIEPGMAFGTGTHETTRLCLNAIEKHYEGESFLDVGTGTGILAIAAKRMYPNAEVSACDNDAEAVDIARENAALNQTAEITFSVGTIDNTTASADFLVANLTADVILSLLPALVGVACGRMVLSGILTEQEEAIRIALHQHGVDEITEVMYDGEWLAIVC